MKYILSILLLGLFFTGCSTKVNVKKFNPAEIQVGKKIVNVYVSPELGSKKFYSLKRDIEFQIFKFKAPFKKDKTFFYIVSKPELADIRIYPTTYRSESNIVRYRGSEETKSCVRREVKIYDKHGHNRSNDYKRKDHNRHYKGNHKHKVIEECIYSKVICTETSANVEISFKVLYNNDQLIKNLESTNYWRKCPNDSNIIPSEIERLEYSKNKIVNDFIDILTPRLENSFEELIDDPDKSFNDRDEDILERAIDYVEDNRIEKAIKYLRAIEAKSFIPHYNLALIHESREEFDLAKEELEKAYKYAPKEERSFIRNHIYRIKGKLNYINN